MYFYQLGEILYKQKRAGVEIKTVLGNQIQLTLVKLAPDFVSSHQHPHEQMGYILSGEAELVIGSEKKVCGRGSAYHIPGHMSHSFRVLSNQPVELLEIFSPPKDENNL